MVGCGCMVTLLGYATLAFLIYRIFIALYKIIYPYFIATPLDLLKRAGGKWAVVTGSTDGIGMAYAHEMAEKGFNILLVSRTQSKLDEVKTDIENKFKVEVKTFSFDFSAGTVEAYEKELVPLLQSLEVGVLVNNVGRSYEYPDVLHKVEGGLKKLFDIDIINMVPPTVLCAAVLPQMVERNAGIIVNVASAAAYNQMKMWAAYCASKKYVIRLTNVMRREYANTDIIIQCVCPMVVTTKMSKVRNPSFFIPSPEQFAKSAVRTIGLAQETTGFFSHQIQVEIMRLPRFIVYAIVDGRTCHLNKKALAKKKENAERVQ